MSRHAKRGGLATPATSAAPRDLPRLRHDLAAWYATDAAAAILCILDHTDYTTASVIADCHLNGLAEAGLYFVSNDMTDLAVTIGTNLDTFAVHADDDLPEDHGLLMWSHRFTDSEWAGCHYSPLAAAWSVNGGGIDVAFYDHLPTASRKVAAIYRAGFHNLGTHPGEIPDLVRLWASRLCADGRERPWAAVLQPEPQTEQAMRTLLATWLLIRQPCDERKSLHETEVIAAPKADLKRIAKGGGPLTVRYVTLRKALHRADDSPDGDAEHAHRIYHHRWFVRPHRANQYYPKTGEHHQIWRGPHLVTPPGCENAPILGGDRVNVLRR